MRIVRICLLAVWILLLIPIPASAQSQNIQQMEWTAEKANQRITSLRDYIMWLGDKATEFEYRLLVSTESEAIRQFPQSPYMAEWRWDRAYYMSLLGDPVTCQTYAGLLQQGFQSQQTSVENLANWVQSQDPRLEVKTTDLGARRGYTQNLLIELSRPGQTGLHFWLLHNTWGDQLYSLCEGREFRESQSGWSELHLEDITGEGLNEVLIYEYSSREPSFRLNIFNLASIPPRRIPFDLPGSLSAVKWSVVRDGQPRPLLQVESSFDFFMGCPITAWEVYRWNGFQLELLQSETDTQEVTARKDSLCAGLFYAAMLKRASKGDAGAITPAVQLIASWPVECLSDMVLHPFANTGCPADVRDEARFRLGLKLALGRNVPAARQVMQTIVNQPSVADSPYVGAARQFLRYYWATSNLSQACRAAGLCYPDMSLEQLIALIPTNYRQSIVQYLQDSGVPVINSGQIDIDSNRLPEYWLQVPHTETQFGEVSAFYCPTGCPPDLWFVVMSNRRFWAFSPGTLNENEAFLVEIHPQVDGSSFFSYLTGGQVIPLSMTRNSVDASPMIGEVCEVLDARLDEIESAMMTGSSAQAINRRLFAWSQAQLPTCLNAAEFVTRSRLQYLLGLSYELMGDSASAQSIYTALRQDYSGSIYALLAETKLGEN